ncbi:tyrosine-type recombinase/integrase [Microbacterium sp. KSW-18]|uniref:Tyrosine-type recombinase/integrase n=1 Tax=Microbacterium aquilitoris TaxID=3067307 RepID=A0ABU3GFH0_9MICO|nr:tyrosine-type recombinase/integrase [Microbacterium sp. KSW-18]MDT3329442.1 tyrosine-type recombinase/integrase [Microbacterium sp. KSW-18]
MSDEYQNNNESTPSAPIYRNRLSRWGDTSEAARHSETLAEHIGKYASKNLPKRLARTVSRCSYEALPPEALNVVKGQKLGDDSADLHDFIRDSVALAAPHTAYAATLLMETVTRYVKWCVRDNGWPLNPHVIWSVRAIDIYSTTANRDRSEGTRRNYRSRLMRVSEVLLPEEHPEKPTPLNKRKAGAPYTKSEMAQFREWATSQLTDKKRDRAMVMLVLCAGAGIRPSEIPLIYPSDITVDDGGILINVRTDEPRVVPLMAEWEEWMVALLERSPADETLWGAITRSTTNNLTSTFTERSNGKPPRADRLRHTWVVRHLEAAVPLKDLYRAAGARKWQDLWLMLEYIEPNTDADYRRALRGEVEA